MTPSNSTIESLANETLSEIFMLTLPSVPSYPSTFFPGPSFLDPSPTQAPLLLCQVSSRWRVLAILDSRLWRGLDVTSVRSPHLVELWLERSCGRALALRTACENRKNTCLPIHRHLSLLLPHLSQCHHLTIKDMFHPPSDSPPPMPELQSLVIRHSNDLKYDGQSLHWFSSLASQAPRLTKLIWTGPPPSSFPWAQLTHLGLSLNPYRPNPPGVYSFKAFEPVLAAIQNVEFLSMDIRVDRFHLFASPESQHTLLNVTTFSVNCNTFPMAFLTLPNLRHLILGILLMSQAIPRVSDFLQRSQCAVTTLELREGGLPDSQITASIWICPQISPSLSRLVIPSQYLNEFFLWAERNGPGTLPAKLVLLRDVDRCFRIDDIDGVAERECSGILAALIRTHLPQLMSLYLDDNCPLEEELESAIVGRDANQFRLWRSVSLRREYQAWWKSSEGIEFRAARSTGIVSAILPFDIDWIQIQEPLKLWNRFAKDDSRIETADGI
ncbi:hypothetical protein R3P38DRAFT_3520424 [Favolaschia claudopus]|uniref:F-box domain-containing protein n=1 Tax=Favolaschia claudopus TaxID=2862362 RepID=A0AAW0BM09_9AGAR